MEKPKGVNGKDIENRRKIFQMEQKVVFLDVDGTMVNSKGIIPESAKEAVQKARKNGCWISWRRWELPRSI